MKKVIYIGKDKLGAVMRKKIGAYSMCPSWVNMLIKLQNTRSVDTCEGKKSLYGLCAFPGYLKSSSFIL